MRAAPYVISAAVIAGVMAPYCWAESEYLVQKIDKNTTETSIIISLVREAVYAIREMAAKSLETLDGISATLNEAMLAIAGINGTVAELHTHAASTSQNVRMIHDGMHAVSAASIEANARAGLLTSRSAEVLQKIDSLEGEIKRLSDVVAEGGRRSAAIESLIVRLPTVAESLRDHPAENDAVLPGDPDTIAEQEQSAEEERRAALPGKLRAGYTEQTVTAYHLARYGQESGGSYALNFEMSCNRDVHVDSVRAAYRHNMTRNDSAPNTFHAGGELVYHSQLEISGNPYDVRLDAHLKPLASPERFGMELRQADQNDTIKRSTKQSNTDLLRIRIEWYTVYESTACPVTFGGQGGFDGKLVQAGQISWGATSPDSGILNDFSSTLHCQGGPVRITSVQAAVPGWPSNLSGYGSVRLSAPGAEHPEVVLPFSDGGTINADIEYAYEGADLVVSGTIPVAGQIVLNLDYVTAANTRCTITR